MYSHLYEYFEIRSEENHNKYKSIEEVEKIFEESNVLIKTANGTFSNNNNFPWINITCVKASNGDYENDKKTKKLNLISAVTSKNENQDIYINFLKEISFKLKWTLVLEEDEYGNENIILAS